jgi:hypothetical protein
MSKEEAFALANSKLEELRLKPFHDLKKFIGSEGARSMEVLGSSGKRYQFQIEALWDNPSKEHLRVMVLIDDYSFLRALRPWSVDFIVDPQGNFIGE